MISTKIIIVGGGVAGLTAGIYAARAGLNPIIAAGNIRPNEMIGGQLMITTDVENFPGFPDGISGPELIERMQRQATKSGATIVEEYATNFNLSSIGGKHQVTIGNDIYETDAIILANGARAKWLGAAREDEFINKGVSACATCDGPLPFLRNKPIIVVGGGDTACEEALFLTNFASVVYIVHRRNTLRASAVMAERVLNHPKIKVLWNTQVVRYYGEKVLEGVYLKEQNKTEQLLECAGVFMGIGHVPNTAGVPEELLDDSGYINVIDNVYTSIPGVFAAGDCHDTYYRQAITASGFGCMASIAAERWISAKDTIQRRQL